MNRAYVAWTSLSLSLFLGEVVRSTAPKDVSLRDTNLLLVGSASFQEGNGVREPLEHALRLPFARMHVFLRYFLARGPRSPGPLSPLDKDLSRARKGCARRERPEGARGKATFPHEAIS